ncbi:hypothetical protein, partial [Mesorhizobium sp. M1C.F.Ca.ET.144.01.1.1]|uniref:hypothetical protein n=1 Tax=Mesorhizobium sp. M1C.F.Ca.ET.144.01.1.1 TaxID=2563921 RepID=UPI001672F47A
DTASYKTTNANAEYEERVAFFSAAKEYRGNYKYSACKRGNESYCAASRRGILLYAKKTVSFSKPRFVFAQIQRAIPLGFVQHISPLILCIRGIGDKCFIQARDKSRFFRII